MDAVRSWEYEIGGWVGVGSAVTKHQASFWAIAEAFVRPRDELHHITSDRGLSAWQGAKQRVLDWGYDSKIGFAFHIRPQDTEN